MVTDDLHNDIVSEARHCYKYKLFVFVFYIFLERSVLGVANGTNITKEISRECKAMNLVKA